ncbi:MAG: glycogen synthase GlgA [Vicinamibacterales bacterium]
MVGSEVLPFAKTGGLADVLSSLPQALARLGHQVTVVMPRYRGIETGEPAGRVPVALPGAPIEAKIWEHVVAPNVRIAFIECQAFYDRDTLYGDGNDDYADNPRRFAFLALAALEYAARQRKPPDVIHAHDWQCGLVPVYPRARASSFGTLASTAMVFTVHNLAYQGLFASDWLPRLGLDWSLFGLDGLEYWGRVSFLKGGINFCDIVTTVSPTYAREIQTPEYGFGFEGILSRRASDLVGILNGIDADCWNPAQDRYLPQPYTVSTVTAGKRAAKHALLGEYKLPTDDRALRRPLVGMISRMVDQKGLDILSGLGDDLASLGATFVVLGTGDGRYEDFWTDLSARYPSVIGARIGFSEPLAHLVEAGSDMFLMPSRFEPCGLNQMYSLRYGTVPIVRATGGLDDTVRDAGPSNSEGNGFKFTPYTSPAFRAALERALAAYEDPRNWKSLQARGMREDFSWDRSADEYVKLYERAIAGRHAATGT